MTAMVDDDLLEQCVIVARYEDLAAKIHARYGRLIDRIEVSIPVENEEDQACLAQIVTDLAR